MQFGNLSFQPSDFSVLIMKSQKYALSVSLSVVQSAIKGLTMGGLEVVSITDDTPVPHNGCRPRKARRM